MILERISLATVNSDHYNWEIVFSDEDFTIVKRIHAKTEDANLGYMVKSAAIEAHRDFAFKKYGEEWMKHSLKMTKPNVTEVIEHAKKIKPTWFKENTAEQPPAA